MKLKSIRGRFLTNVLPIMLIPLVLLGFSLWLAWASSASAPTTRSTRPTIFSSSTTPAFADIMGGAAQSGVEAVNDFMFQWFGNVSSIDGASDASELAESFVVAGIPQSDVQVVFTTADGSLLTHSHPGRSARRLLHVRMARAGCG